MDLGIAGRVAMVAASSKGIGRAAAMSLLAEGCRVSICARTAVELEAAREEMAAAAPITEVFGSRCDVSSEEDLAAWHAATTERFGKVDVLVTNTGGPPAARFLDLSEEQWRAGIEGVLLNVVRLSRLVIPGMRERRWGRIVCMASIAGLMGGFGQTAYATSKMGVIGFARSVALEGARYNVTSNVIAPGIVGPNANMSPLYDRMVKRVAMQREEQPEDIASAIAFLCSERARYITGAVLTVTGGMDLFTF
jgi:3-oxoacyl-[acyl-carrier protein] reductase